MVNFKHLVRVFFVSLIFISWCCHSAEKEPPKVGAILYAGLSPDSEIPEVDFTAFWNDRFNARKKCDDGNADMCLQEIKFSERGDDWLIVGSNTRTPNLKNEIEDTFVYTRSLKEGGTVESQFEFSFHSRQNKDIQVALSYKAIISAVTSDPNALLKEIFPSPLVFQAFVPIDLGGKDLQVSLWNSYKRAGRTTDSYSRVAIIPFSSGVINQTEHRAAFINTGSGRIRYKGDGFTEELTNPPKVYRYPPFKSASPFESIKDRKGGGGFMINRGTALLPANEDVSERGLFVVIDGMPRSGTIKSKKQGDKYMVTGKLNGYRLLAVSITNTIECAFDKTIRECRNQAK